MSSNVELLYAIVRIPNRLGWLSLGLTVTVAD